MSFCTRLLPPHRNEDAGGLGSTEEHLAGPGPSAKLHNLRFKLQYTENRNDSRRSLAPQDLWESGMWKRAWRPPKLSRAAGAAQALTTAKGSLLLGALRRRGHKEGLPSGRRAINNPEAIASAALFKDGGGGTSAAEAGATG